MSLCLVTISVNFINHKCLESRELTMYMNITSWIGSRESEVGFCPPRHYLNDRRMITTKVVSEQ